MRLAFACLLWAGGLAAQTPRLAEPNRVDSLLAQGRLAAAEATLYAASDARPRDPAARGALAAYLASRGRFAIAMVLFDEAQRFGADAARVNLARAAVRPYTRAAAPGGETTVALRPSRTPGLLGSIDVRRSRAASETVAADIDANVTGLVAGVGAASVLGARRGRELGELWIGERRLADVSMRVDSTLGVGELRIGLDLLWALEPIFDERAGTLTLGRRAPSAAAGTQIPWVLTFPGLQLVPRVGEAPLRIESAAGRAMLRGTRWQLDPRQATIRVER
ncbi:MAG TPA: hypothetical protein PK788_13075, partial [Gemmatimonadaceae bacterium]|nr:hypothetical protein [Gemmatimonadaceae bacterium]HRQ77750.1 hypothetical protein [Gemmatimonadaceae bacterium]